jgi:hypothetical protein
MGSDEGQEILELILIDDLTILLTNGAGDGELLATLKSADRSDLATEILERPLHAIPNLTIRDHPVTILGNVQGNDLIVGSKVITNLAMICHENLVVLKVGIILTNPDEAGRLNNVEEERLDCLLVDDLTNLCQTMPFGSLD